MFNSKIIKSTFIVVILTIFSKVLGFFREVIIASKFGASYATDIYTFSVGLVNLLFASIGAGLGATFIPILTEYIENFTEYQRERFVNNIINITFIFTLIVLILSFSLRNYIVSFFAPGFAENNEIFTYAVSVIGVMLASIVFIGIQSILSGVLQSHNEFTIPSSISVASNVIIIFYLIILCNSFGVKGLAVATVIGFVVQVVIHIPKFISLGYRYRFIIDFKDEGLRKILVLMVPTIISVSLGQINFLVDRLLASTLYEGAISVLNFAYKLIMMVNVIFTLSIATVIFPKLSEYASQNGLDEYRNMLIKTLNIVLLVMIPATVGMVVLRMPIVDLLFKRGAFDVRAAHLTSIAVLFYSPIMILFGINDILYRAFYAKKNTKSPMLISIVGVIINIVLNLILIKYMEIAGLALATSISAIFTTLLLLGNLNNSVGDLKLMKLLKSFLKVMFASSVMGVCVTVFTKFYIYNYELNTKTGFILIIVASIVGVIIYSVIISLLNVQEFKYITDIIGDRIKRIRDTSK